MCLSLLYSMIPELYSTDCVSPLPVGLMLAPVNRRYWKDIANLEEKDFFFFQCFIFLHGGKWVSSRGPGSVPSTKDGSWVQKQALSNTCQHTLSTGRGLNPSLTGASSSEFLSFFINHLSFSFRDSYRSLQLLLQSSSLPLSVINHLLLSNSLY